MCIDLASLASQYLGASTWSTISTVVASAAALTAVVPLPKTGPFAVLSGVINAVALNIGHAKNQ